MMKAGFLRDTAIAVLALAVLIAIPFIFTKPSLRDFLIYVMAYGLLAMSLNLLVGLTGQVSFGHAAYFVSGAYMFGLLMQTGRVSIPLAILVTVFGTAILALVIGAICVRLKEIYFSFITLAFQMFIHSIILTWVSLTGGDQATLGVGTIGRGSRRCGKMKPLARQRKLDGTTRQLEAVLESLPGHASAATLAPPAGRTPP